MEAVGNCSNDDAPTAVTSDCFTRAKFISGVLVCDVWEGVVIRFQIFLRLVLRILQQGSGAIYGDAICASVCVRVERAYWDEFLYLWSMYWIALDHCTHIPSDCSHRVVGTEEKDGCPIRVSTVLSSKPRGNIYSEYILRM